MQHKRILAAIQSELWAITPEALQQVVAVAQGFGDAEAVAAKLGRPLNNTRTVSVRDGVAVVPVIGPIFRYANLMHEISGATSVQTLATDLQAAVDDPAIKAIILEIDSPGGQVSGISEFAQQIRAADAVKPVYSYVSNRAQSAGYFIAAAGREIIVNDMAILGSIGAALEMTLEKSDDGTETIKVISEQSPLKQADPRTEEGLAEYQQLINAMGGVFVQKMAEYRGVDVDHVLEHFGKGGSFLAADAIAAGMADRIGSLESLIAELNAGHVSKPKPLRGKTMPITREQIAAEAPDLLLALTEEGRAAGYAAGLTAGAENERNRIKEIEALAMPGHDALLASLKFDGATTAGEAAMKMIAAEKQNRVSMAERIASETLPPVAHAVPALNDNSDPEGADEDDLDGDDDEIEAAAKTKWKKDKSLRAEFTSFDAFVAYERAVNRGAARVLGGK